jgi:hypothetical protein
VVREKDILEEDLERKRKEKLEETKEKLIEDKI